MAMDWLFGRRIDYSSESGITINLPSYVIDIDVALDIVRMMEKRRDERLESLEQQLTTLRLGRTPDGGTDAVIKRLEGQRDSLVVAAPHARLHPVSWPWATASIEPSYDVPGA